MTSSFSRTVRSSVALSPVRGDVDRVHRGGEVLGVGGASWRQRDRELLAELEGVSVLIDGVSLTLTVSLFDHRVELRVIGELRDRTGTLEGTVSTFIRNQGKVEAA